jgi:hypothetical protein
VKRSGRNEAMCSAIHKYREAALGISLYSYLYLKLAKMLFFLLSLKLSLQQNWRTREKNRFCLEARRAWGVGRRGIEGWGWEER